LQQRSDLPAVPRASPSSGQAEKTFAASGLFKFNGAGTQSWLHLDAPLLIVGALRRDSNEKADNARAGAFHGDYAGG